MPVAIIHALVKLLYSAFVQPTNKTADFRKDVVNYSKTNFIEHNQLEL